MRSSFVNLVALAAFAASLAPAMAQDTDYPAPLLPLQFRPLNNALLGRPSAREETRGLLPLQFRPLPDQGQILPARQIGNDIHQYQLEPFDVFRRSQSISPVDSAELDQYKSPPFVNPADFPPSSSTEKRQLLAGSSQYSSPPFVNPADFPPANAPRPNIQLGRRDESLAPILGNGVVAGIGASIANSKGQDIFSDNERREMRELYVDTDGGVVYVNVDGADTFVQRSISDLSDEELLAIMIRLRS